MPFCCSSSSLTGLAVLLQALVSAHDLALHHHDSLDSSYQVIRIRLDRGLFANLSSSSNSSEGVIGNILTSIGIDKDVGETAVWR